MTSHWYRNAEVYTVDRRRPWARCLVERDGRIVYVGDEPGAREHLDDDTVEVDLGGRFLMPGFVDAHDHLLMGAIGKIGVSLENLTGRDAVMATIARYVAEHPDDSVIRGHGWTQFTFGDGVQPHRHWLDEVVVDRPALLNSYDIHDAWVNTAGFAAAGIDASTPDPNPPLSYYPRDPDGFPTGTCCEPEAWIPIAFALGLISADAAEEVMELTLWPAPSWGITTYFDALAGPTPQLAHEVYERLIAIDASRGLPVRIIGSYGVRDPDEDPQRSAAVLTEMNRDLRSDHLSITTLKLFLDGVGPQHTARLLEPYDDQPGHQGSFLFDPELVRAHLLAVNRAGFDGHMHACGDAAVRGALDACEAARAEVGDPATRNTICHLELCNIDDITRFAQLGVIANATPLWGTDYRGEFMNSYPGLIGWDRFSRDYTPYGSLIRSGATVTFGADCPGVEVHEIAPLVQLEAAVTRQRPGFPDDAICWADQRLSLAEAIQCFTLNGAYALRLEHQIGSLTAGKRADLVVLETNPFRVDPHEIHTIGIDLTVLDGAVTYRRGA